mmetsp:Transcript_16182/g.44804  ORF Transcript_16182/g.44804 Transcript_16182/m.44804 type:complete len:537 (+) Transcript_16182:127-1737(+)
MNGETFTADPDFTVVFGCRSTLALIGLSTGVLGYWLMERKWDNKSIVALEKPEVLDSDTDDTDDEVENGSSGMYVNMYDQNRVVGQGFHPGGERDLVRVTTDDSIDQRYHPEQAAAKYTDPVLSVEAAQYYGSPELVWELLSKSLTLRRMMLIGFGLWGLSFFLDPSRGGFRLYANFWNTCCSLLAILIGPTLAFPLRAATLKRYPGQKKRVLIAIAGCLSLICFMAIIDPEVDGPWYFNLFGILLVMSSYPVFMASRKMGHTWFLEGKPKQNSDILIQNMGPNLLIFGAFLLWVGTNAVAMADLNQNYLPFWTESIRGCFVFIAGMMMIVPGELAMELAFDQGSQPVLPGFKDTYVFKLDGNTFAELARAKITLINVEEVARLLETPLLGSLGWFLMGLCSFMPFGVRDPTFQKFFAMFVCFAIPSIQYGFLNPAVWRSDLEEYKKWNKVHMGLMMLLAVTIGIGSGIAFLLSVFGVALILSGHRKDFYDERKRGFAWMHGTPPALNPCPQVYGLGRPLYLIGWIMLCAAMSVPM